MLHTMNMKVVAGYISIQVTTTSAKSHMQKILLFCGIAHLKEKITAIGYICFHKTTPFLSFEGKKCGQEHLFFLV